MKTIKLAKAWSYITPEKTVDYPAGEHGVTNEIAEAAVKAGVVEGEPKDGDRTAATGAAGSAGAAKG